MTDEEKAELEEALNNHPETASVTQLMELIKVREENKRQKAQITELEKRINTLKIKNASLQKKNEQQAKQIEHNKIANAYEKWS